MFQGKKLEALRTALTDMAGTADRLEAQCAVFRERGEQHESRIEALSRDIGALRSELQDLRRLVHGALMDPESEDAQMNGISALLQNETDELPQTEEWKQAREEQRLFVIAWNKLYGNEDPLFMPEEDGNSEAS